MDTNELKAKIFYFCREKHYHATQATCLDGLRQFPENGVFQLYKALSLVLNGNINDGIRELGMLQRDADMALGAIIALQAAHKRSGAAADKEVLAQLDSRIKLERKKAGEVSLYHAAYVLFYLERPNKANEYVDKLLKAYPSSVDGLVAKGWIELAGSNAKDAGKYFEAALERDRKNLDAAFGKVRHAEVSKDYVGGITLLSALISRYPTFTPPLVEKMKLHLATFNWEQALETSVRILTIDPQCIQAQQVKILSLICREANYEDAALNLRRLYADMEKKEPDNALLFLENAHLFSRICGANAPVIAETYRFVEKASQLDATNADVMSELGYQCLLQNKTKDALRYYRSATKADDSSMTALFGLTVCQIKEAGFNQQVQQQIEFLQEIQATEPTSNILLLAAQLQRGNYEKAISYLNNAVEIHIKTLNSLPFGFKYLLCLDPELLLQFVKEYRRYAPVQPATVDLVTSGGPVPVPLKQSLYILNHITKACPGLLEGLSQLAHVQYLCRDLKLATKTLHHIIDNVDATCVQAHLLLAQINVEQGNYKRAEQCLEHGISFNFKVRENPIYHLISALCQKKQGDVKACIATLQMVMTQSDARGINKQSAELALPDKASMYLELSDAYRILGQKHEAAQVIHEAVELFKGTSEEGRLTIANADLALQSEDTTLALKLLDTVKPGHPYFNQACCKKADIHLNFRKDQRAFTECYRDLVARTPDAPSFVMLGDSYISVQEPDLAIEAYEKALKLHPRDAELCCKMGKALIRCHEYSKAINFYKETMKDEECCMQLKYDMAELHMRMGQVDIAEKTILQELEVKGDDDISALIGRTKLLMLLAKVKEKAGNIPLALNSFREARDNQSKLLKRAEIAQSSQEERVIAANICQRMAEHSHMLRDNEAAVRSYKEALTYNPGDANILVALAKLYMQIGDLEQCQMNCMLLLNSDANNEAAMVMMADLAFRKIDFETAKHHFQQLLEKHPNYWTALARLVEVTRRMGRLEEVVPYLAGAEAATVRAHNNAGLFYCKGLHAWYSGNRNAALKYFNRARRDPEWGQQAVYNMVKICLSTEDDQLGYVADDDDAYGGARDMTLRMADQLLKELKPRIGGGRDQALSHRLLTNFMLLASAQKPNIERALQDLTALAGQEPFQDHVGVAYGLAVTYMLLKQIPRARNQLKRVAKYRWNFEDADYLESCWLLLTEIYVQNSKYDMASELVKKILHHNKGNIRAYEFAGIVAEKEQGYREAAIQYDHAWRFGGRTNSAIGYKLAFNHMKSKRYVDAIDVCQVVLKMHPDFPRIRKEILEKSRNNLKT